MPNPTQLALFEKPQRAEEISRFILDLLQAHQLPSPSELVIQVEKRLGMEARWELLDVVVQLADSPNLTQSNRNYLHSLVVNGGLSKALRGEDVQDRETISSIDLLLKQSQRYNGSEAFQGMIDFMGRFRDYAPYNNMLVHLQNPSCGFYATAKDWAGRFDRTIKEDAHPMLILAPMHPVMLVYDLDQTEGKDLPEELQQFARFESEEWDDRWLERLVENAGGHRILIQFKTLSSTHGGFATLARDTGDWKMRVVIHDQLNKPSRFGVLCHEIAHILLGHLGSDWDHWWPARTNLGRAPIEVEAESVAWIVTSRLGITGSSAAYVSRQMPNGQTPAGVSLDMIAKVSGYIERMARETMTPRRPREKK